MEEEEKMNNGVSGFSEEITNSTENLNNEKKAKKPKRKFVIVGVCLALLVAIVSVVCVVIFTSPNYKIRQALGEKDYDLVKEILLENENEQELCDAVSAYISKETNKFQKGDVEYTNVDDMLKAFKDVVDVSENRNLVNTVNASKINYNQAIETKDSHRKLELFSKVTEEDIANYTDAQSKMKELLDSEIAEIERLIQEKKYAEAYKLIESIDDYEYISGKTSDLKEQAVGAYQKEIYADMQEYVSKGSYYEAYKRADTEDSVFQSKEIVTLKQEAKDSYVSQVLSEAETKVAGGDYDSAIQLLENANNNIYDSRIANKAEEYSKNKNIQLIKSYKQSVNVFYDNIERKYKIKVKGLASDVISINGSRNIEEYIVVDSTANFYMYFGFVNDDWIFMDKIIIDCDGKQHTITVGYFDRITEIWGGGNIAEAYGVVDSHIGTTYGQLVELDDIVKDMINASKVSIRFKGDGYKDVNISKTHLDEVRTLWNIYNILSEDESLIEYLK